MAENLGHDAVRSMLASGGVGGSRPRRSTLSEEEQVRALESVESRRPAVVEEEPVEVDEELDAARSKLKADGWDDDELAGLSKEAALKRASKIKVPEPSEDVEYDVDDIRAELEKEMGKKAAAAVVDKFMVPMRKRDAARAAQAAEREWTDAVSRSVKLYPEIRRPAAAEAVRAVVARTGSSVEAALVEVYGDRRAEVRDQLDGQMSSGGSRSEPARKVPREKAEVAALEEFERTGSMKRAMNLKRTLLGG